MTSQASRGAQALLVSLLIPLTFSCMPDLPDYRLGDLERVRFTGGAAHGVSSGSGCDLYLGPPILAVGGTVTFTLEAAGDGDLPEGLFPRSSAPSVLRVRRGGAPMTIVVEALEQGDAAIELLRDGAVYDRFALSTRHVRRAAATGPERVAEGFHARFDVWGVEGQCPAEHDASSCPLLGNGPVEWRSFPEGAVSPASLVGTRATFHVLGGLGTRRFGVRGYALDGRGPYFELETEVVWAEVTGPPIPSFAVREPSRVSYRDLADPREIPVGSYVRVTATITNVRGVPRTDLDPLLREDFEVELAEGGDLVVAEDDPTGDHPEGWTHPTAVTFRAESVGAVTMSVTTPVYAEAGMASFEIVPHVPPEE